MRVRVAIDVGGMAVDGAGVAQAPGAGVLRILDKVTLAAATPFVYPQLAPGALDGVVSNATSAYGAGKLHGVFQHVQPNTICEFKLRVMIWKRLSWVLTSVTLTFDL